MDRGSYYFLRSNRECFGPPSSWVDAYLLRIPLGTRLLLLSVDDEGFCGRFAYKVSRWQDGEVFIPMSAVSLEPPRGGVD